DLAAAEERLAIDGNAESRFTAAPTRTEPVDLCVWSKHPVELTEGEELVVSLRSIDPDGRGLGTFRVGTLSEPDPIDAPDDAYRLVVRPPGREYNERQIAIVRRYREDSSPVVRALLDRLAALEEENPALRPHFAPVLAERRESRR